MTSVNTVEIEERGVAAGNRGLYEFWKPLSWSAIVGGAVTALAIQVILTLLGIGLGLAMVNPMTDADPARGMGTAAIIWLIVSGIISFGAGGWVAGHMSGVLRTGSGFIHGAAAWSLAAVFGVVITALAGSSVVGGVAAGAGAAAPTAQSAMASTPPGTRFSTAADGTVRWTDTYGRPMTETEVRTAADDARKAAAHAALWTGVAFLLSMVAGGFAGHLARMSPQNLLSAGTRVQPRPV